MINKAVSSTIELESYVMKLNTPQNSSSVSQVSTGETPVAESIQAVQRDLVETMQKLVEKVEKLKLDASQHIYQPPRHGRGPP